MSRPRKHKPVALSARHIAAGEFFRFRNRAKHDSVFACSHLGSRSDLVFSRREFLDLRIDALLEETRIDLPVGRSIRVSSRSASILKSKNSRRENTRSLRLPRWLQANTESCSARFRKRKNSPAAMWRADRATGLCLTRFGHSRFQKTRNSNARNWRVYKNPLRREP